MAEVAQKWPAVLARRWPTALALAIGAVLWSGGVDDDAIISLGEAVLVLPLEYLILTQLGRPRSSWLVVALTAAGMVLVELIDLVPLSVALVGVALVLLVVGAVTGTPSGRRLFGVQALGMLGFGAAALVALALDPGVARYLVAAAWLAHGLWDAVHWKLDRVVSRSYAEACGVVDIAVGVLLLVI